MRGSSKEGLPKEPLPLKVLCFRQLSDGLQPNGNGWAGLTREATSEHLDFPFTSTETRERTAAPPRGLTKVTQLEAICLVGWRPSLLGWRPLLLRRQTER